MDAHNRTNTGSTQPRPARDTMCGMQEKEPVWYWFDSDTAIDTNRVEFVQRRARGGLRIGLKSGTVVDVNGSLADACAYLGIEDVDVDVAEES